MINKVLFVFLLVFISSDVISSEYHKRGIHVVGVESQASRPAKPNLGNNDYLYIENGAWSGPNSCQTDVLVLPESNATMKSIALAALASGKTVDVYVDDTLPLVAGVFCTITVLHINKD